MGKPKSSEVWASVEAKMLSLVFVNENGCWIYTGFGGRYGDFCWDGKITKAHRVAYELRNGPIPEGIKVCHSCDVARCVNPDHLWLGTDAENIRDMIVKGRQVILVGEGNGNAVLTADEVRQIRKLLAEGVLTQAQIGEDFNITQAAVSAIKLGIRWKSVQ